MRMLTTMLNLLLISGYSMVSMSIEEMVKAHYDRAIYLLQEGNRKDFLRKMKTAIQLDLIIQNPIIALGSFS
jgi:hypothetical protein